MQRTADSGAVLSRWVCPECGSWVCGTSSSDDLRRLRAGTLDDTTWVRPTAHFWTRSNQPWITLPEGDQIFRDAACHIIRADETAFSRPILALGERDGELCRSESTSFHECRDPVAQAHRRPSKRPVPRGARAFQSWSRPSLEYGVASADLKPSIPLARSRFLERKRLR